MNAIALNQTNTGQTKTPTPRRRLKPEVRMAQILDAALHTFSQSGYAATRMDDIARRAGLSKGGVYAHFKSKEAIFEALIQHVVRPIELPEPPSGLADTGARALARWLVEQLHAVLDHPQIQAMVQLMVAEGARAPELLALWEHNVIAPRMEMIARTLALLPTPAGMKQSVLIRAPWLAVSPLVHALLMQVVFGKHSWLSREHVREAHIDMLAELLDPYERAQSPARPA